MFTYHREKELVHPHFGVSRRGVEVMGGWGEGGNQWGVRWLWCLMAGWLVCTVVLVMPVVGGPICMEAGIFLDFCLVGGPVHR